MIKKLNIFPMAAIILGGTLAIVKPTPEEKTFQTMIKTETIAHNTTIDEAITEGKLKYSDEGTILQAADKLEKVLKITQKLQDMDLSDTDQIIEIEDEDIENISIKDIELLMKQAKAKTAPYERKFARQKLRGIKDYCNKWEKENIDLVCIELLKATIKGTTSASIGTKLDNVVIPGKKGMQSSVTIKGVNYQIPHNSITAKAIQQTYKLQERHGAPSEMKEYKKALQYARKVLRKDPYKNGPYRTRF